MTRSTALGMLKVGNTGDEILQILDVIVADIESDTEGGTHFLPFFVSTVTLNV